MARVGPQTAFISGFVVACIVSVMTRMFRGIRAWRGIQHGSADLHVLNFEALRLSIAAKLDDLRFQKGCADWRGGRLRDFSAMTQEDCLTFHALVRLACREARPNLTQKEILGLAAELHLRLHPDPAKGSLKRCDDMIRSFVVKWYMGTSFDKIREAGGSLATTLLEVFEETGRKDEEVYQLLGNFCRSDMHLLDAFIRDQRHLHYCADLRKAITKKEPPRGESNKSIPTTHFSLVLRSLSEMWPANADCRLDDSDLRELINDAENKGRSKVEFAFVRKHARKPRRYIVHILGIGCLRINPALMYFSEWYKYAPKNKALTDRRTQGVCYFDGQFLVGLARGDYTNTDYVMHFEGRIPKTRKGRFDAFPGSIFTQNALDSKISASGLCVRCDDLKSADLIGDFSLDDLLDRLAAQPYARRLVAKNARKFRIFELFELSQPDVSVSP